LTAREMQKELVESGLAATPNEAAHMLVDCGEIDSTEHAELLSPAERDRIYS